MIPVLRGWLVHTFMWEKFWGVYVFKILSFSGFGQIGRHVEVCPKLCLAMYFMLLDSRLHEPGMLFFAGDKRDMIQGWRSTVSRVSLCRALIYRNMCMFWSTWKSIYWRFTWYRVTFTMESRETPTFKFNKWIWESHEWYWDRLDPCMVCKWGTCVALIWALPTP